MQADETIYAESATPTAEAAVTAERQHAAPLRYMLKVSIAREAVEVWEAWRPGQRPSLEDKVAAVIYYAQNDAAGSAASSERWPRQGSPAPAGPRHGRAL